MNFSLIVKRQQREDLKKKKFGHYSLFNFLSPIINFMDEIKLRSGVSKASHYLSFTDTPLISKYHSIL